MAIIKISTPLTEEVTASLKAGDNVRISGILYTARDAAHKRLVSLISEGKQLPMDIQGQIVYYVGPAPAKPGQAIGSAVLQPVIVWIHMLPFSWNTDSKA